MHVIAAKAVCFLEAMQPEFVAYSKQVLANAHALAKGLQEEGFRIVSGGTDTHVMLVDVFSKGVRGREAEQSLDRARITVNKNAIPFDVNPPLNPSGIRLGSPAATTRGFGEARDARGGVADRRSPAATSIPRRSSPPCAQRVEALTIAIPALRLEDAGCAGRCEMRRENRHRHPAHSRLRRRHLHPQSAAGSRRRGHRTSLFI